MWVGEGVLSASTDRSEAREKQGTPAVPESPLLCDGLFTVLTPETDALLHVNKVSSFLDSFVIMGGGILRGQRGQLKHTSLAQVITFVPAIWVCWYVWSCCSQSSWYFELNNRPKNYETCLASTLTFCYFLISWFCEKKMYFARYDRASGNHGYSTHRILSWGAGGNRQGSGEQERRENDEGSVDGWGREPERRSETGALLPGGITRVCILHDGQALHRLSLTFNTTAFLGLNVTLIKRESQDK